MKLLQRFTALLTAAVLMVVVMPLTVSAAAADSGLKYTLSGTSFVYTGKAVTPSVSVKTAKGASLKKGKDYTTAYKNNVKIGTAYVKVTLKGKYKGSKSLSFKILPGKASVAFSASSNSVKLSWKAVKGASAYEVYRYDSSSKKYKSIGKTKNTSYTVKSLSALKEYLFKVRAYATVSGKTYAGAYSSAVKAYTLPAQVTSLKADYLKNNITLTWKKQANVTGYTVYIYKADKKKYVKLADTKENKYIYKNAKAGQNYKFAVDSYKVTSDKKVYRSKKVGVSCSAVSQADFNKYYNILRKKDFKCEYEPSHSTPGPYERLIRSVTIGNGVARYAETGSSRISSYNAASYYNKDKSVGYVYMYGTGLFAKSSRQYQKLTKKQATDIGFDENGIRTILAPEIASGKKPTHTKEKSYDVWSYIAKNGNTVKYYLKSGKLEKIVFLAKGSILSEYNIVSFTTDVKETDTALPKDFPKGFTERDFFVLN